MKKRKIEIRIMDEKGHTVKNLSAEEALVEVRQQQKQGKWVFADGSLLNSDRITVETLESVSEITITRPIAGG